MLILDFVGKDARVVIIEQLVVFFVFVCLKILNAFAWMRQSSTCVVTYRPTMSGGVGDGGSMTAVVAMMEEARRAMGRGEHEVAIEKAGRALEEIMTTTTSSGDADAENNEPSVEVARAHATYGEALFRGARATNTVFGEKVRENAEASGTRLEDAEDEDAGEDEDEDEEAGKGKEPVNDDDDEEEEGEEEEEESDMELAWKMLEIARVMYEDLGSAPLELADVLETVGELNMEQSQFDAAVKDYGSALALLEANLDATDRRLASALYSMSMAHQMLEANDDALAATSRAVRICEARAAELKAGTALVSKGARENAGQPLSPEATIAELEEIMAVASDLKEREEELKELVSADNSTREALRAAFKAIGGAAPEPASAPEEGTGFAAPKLQSSLPVQAAPVRKVVPAPVRKVEVAPLREAPVKRADPQQTAPAAPAQPEAKKLKLPPAETPTEAPKDAEPNGCAQQ